MNSNCLQQFPDYVYRFPDCQTCEQTLKVLQVKIESIKANKLEFDLIGVKPFIANSIRQTILNDVPTMAIEDVYFHKNTSTFNCDYISQRLALIPIKANPALFKFMPHSNLERFDSDNAFVLSLNVKNNQTETIKVYSDSLVWEPVGDKQKNFAKIEPLHSNIPILYLKPGEEISCRIHCIKSTGRKHMKFAPGFGKYVFHSKIDILREDFSPELASKLQQSFPPGVIGIKHNQTRQLIPYVANARLDRHTRSFKNDEEVNRSISVKYYRDHIIFTVESFGVLDPVRMTISAFDILNYKYNFYKDCIENYRKRMMERDSKN